MFDRFSVFDLSAFLSLEALFAIHRPVIGRLERNLGRFAAFRAGNIVHLSLSAAETAPAVRLFRLAAIRATHRFVLEPFLSIKLLLRSREREVATAIAAFQLFVLIHDYFLPSFLLSHPIEGFESALAGLSFERLPGTILGLLPN